jgi:hypothetical protein
MHFFQIVTQKQGAAAAFFTQCRRTADQFENLAKILCSNSEGMSKSYSGLWNRGKMLPRPSSQMEMRAQKTQLLDAATQ